MDISERVGSRLNPHAEWALGEGRDLTQRDERYMPPPPGPPVAPWVEGG